MAPYILKFNEIGISDIPRVGGKNASIGEIFNTLSGEGILMPDGFAVTSDAYWYFMNSNNLVDAINSIMSRLDRQAYTNLREIGKEIRTLIVDAIMPVDLAHAITTAYLDIDNSGFYEMAVRSSATAEDLPGASFAGQHESYLGVRGKADLLLAVQKCFASLYTDRAIKYREDKGFDHSKIALSVGVQKMVHADRACAGICFTLEPESGFRDVIHISGVWGLGENIVQGTVSPDEFYVFKPTLRQGKNAILNKKLGEKQQILSYKREPALDEMVLINTDTPADMRAKYVLNDEEITTVARWAQVIEDHYKQPMDIEWAKDGRDGKLYIVQARPETIHSNKNPLQLKEFRLLEKGKTLVEGEAVGSKIVTGVVKVLSSPADAYKLSKGDIVVTELTSPDWDPILKTVSAIITDSGGRTSHASIVARELGVPAVVGTNAATRTLKDGQVVTVSCAEGKTGFVYDGQLKWAEQSLDFTNFRMPERTKAMMITGDPAKAFQLSFYPNDGVGLLRMEFIINHFVQVHPMALVKYEELNDAGIKSIIAQLTVGYDDKRQYFIDKLAHGVGTIAAAFYPKDVIVRMSDFKTNEYANLLGGKDFEPVEENPMIGFRGASRYYNPMYSEGFRLECAAIKKLREEMGLVNIKVMIPFCRTVDEGRKVVEIMEQYGLKRGAEGLEIYVMAEIPSNVIEAEDFATVFDGFSIGSNDLTQLTLGIDRDSAIIAPLFTEQNKSVKFLIEMVIRKARAMNRKIGLCGQAPSDIPEFASFLVAQGIDSISFNPDALLKGIENIKIAEKTLAEKQTVSA